MSRLALWQAATTLREYRGDGHYVALALAGLDGVEALVTHTAIGGEVRESIQARRDGPTGTAERHVSQRGLLAEDNQLSAGGLAVRRAVQDDIDRLAAAPWQALREDRSRRLYQLLRPRSERFDHPVGIAVAAAQARVRSLGLYRASAFGSASGRTDV